MDKQKVAILVTVNFALILLGAFAVYCDLYTHRYSVPPYAAVEPPTNIEWGFFQYRPTLIERDGTMVQGSWTLDFFQLSILVAAIGDILWILSNRRQALQKEAD